MSFPSVQCRCLSWIFFYILPKYHGQKSPDRPFLIYTTFHIHQSTSSFLQKNTVQRKQDYLDLLKQTYFVLSQFSCHCVNMMECFVICLTIKILVWKVSYPCFHWQLGRFLGGSCFGTLNGKAFCPSLFSGLFIQGNTKSLSSCFNVLQKREDEFQTL